METRINKKCIKINFVSKLTKIHYKQIYKSIIILIVGFVSCHNEVKETSKNLNHSPIEERKTQLRHIDSLIRVGEHRKALTLLDTFQAREKDQVFLIQSEILLEEALDSFYNE